MATGTRLKLRTTLAYTSLCTNVPLVPTVLTTPKVRSSRCQMMNSSTMMPVQRMVRLAKLATW